MSSIKIYFITVELGILVNVNGRKSVHIHRIHTYAYVRTPLRIAIQAISVKMDMYRTLTSILSVYMYIKVQKHPNVSNLYHSFFVVVPAAYPLCERLFGFTPQKPRITKQVELLSS